MRSVRITRGVDVRHIPTGARSFASVGPRLEVTPSGAEPAAEARAAPVMETPAQPAVDESPSGERLERALLDENEALRATVRQLESQRLQDVDAAEQTVRAALDEKVAQAVESFTSAVESLVRARVELSESSEKQVTELAFAIARRVVTALQRRDEEVVVETVRKALALVREEERVVVRVHPSQLEQVDKHQPDWVAAVRNARSLSVEADPRIEPGGCLVKTERGDVDARIESQLDVLEEKLLERSE